MKIGIISNLYPPYARGGAENIIVRTVEQLLVMGHDVFVITGKPKNDGLGATLGTLSIERVYQFFSRNIYFTLDDYKYPKIIRIIWHAIDAFGFSGAKTVGGILQEERPDVIITHNLKGIGLRIPRVVQKMNIPHIHVLHDLQLVTPSGLRMFGQEHEAWYLAPFYAMYRAVCRRRLGKPLMVISPSEFLIDEYRRAGFFQNTDVRFLPNPSPKTNGTLRKSRRDEVLRLLFIGQLGHHKGLPFLLDAFAKYEGDARLAIVGGGPLRSFVEERARHDSRIVYLGYTPQEEIMKCIGGTDAVIVPSLCYENSPTVIYEALSAGVPVIASRIGGVGELVVDGLTGLLFTPGDEADLLSKIRIMDQKKGEFADRSERIRESVLPYELPKYAERFVELIQEGMLNSGR